MDARAILVKLRDGVRPGPEEIAWFARGLASGAVTDSQAGAFAMAVCQRGLGDEGRVALTLAMRDSGDVLDWALPGPVVDKHSTGGIGDSISLLLAPALAACGVYVPMVSGRGLGHTGGTLDKLESIPGYGVEVSADRLGGIVRDIGCAIIGATGRIAPADKRLYAVRDVTGTVESIDLITASILSKKLAAGLQGLVLDVKVGSGAFMQAPQDARALARALVETAKGAGCPTRALITDMDQPLALTAGNALEVAEVMDCLTGGAITQNLWDLTVALGGELLALCGVQPDAARGGAAIAEALHRGHAAERFGAMVAALGGPADFVENWRAHLPEAGVVRDVPAPAEGRVVAVDTGAVGLAVVALGGGRQRDGDRIDPSVGYSALTHIGDKVGPGQPIGRVHAADDAAAQAGVQALQAAYRVGGEVDPPPLIHERIA
ncbi:thymidine phosphorylase [Frigidibacter sp. ROC022]|uniref:thymidine phosphorylase n=1 Tax=Frigidibacter sp. ROC022 TaxID=2971796 RepID=UPI00215B2141|nr:thymidine phosphorylase [Frigidibacter sp. ROC022]MCR8723010.1 thymidine phosphorylase [Frigidibacter sp. ROC022]